MYPVQLVKYIMTKKEQLRITMSCHMDPTSGHLGIKKTYYRITERFTWNGVMKDVQEVVSIIKLMLIYKLLYIILELL